MIIYTCRVVQLPFMWDTFVNYQGRYNAELHPQWIDLKHLQNNQLLIS